MNNTPKRHGCCLSTSRNTRIHAYGYDECVSSRSVVDTVERHLYYEQQGTQTYIYSNIALSSHVQDISISWSQSGNQFRAQRKSPFVTSTSDTHTRGRYPPPSPFTVWIFFSHDPAKAKDRLLLLLLILLSTIPSSCIDVRRLPLWWVRVHVSL